MPRNSLLGFYVRLSCNSRMRFQSCQILQILTLLTNAGVCRKTVSFFPHSGFSSGASWRSSTSKISPCHDTPTSQYHAGRTCKSWSTQICMSDLELRGIVFIVWLATRLYSSNEAKSMRERVTESSASCRRKHTYVCIYIYMYVKTIRQIFEKEIVLCM